MKTASTRIFVGVMVVGLSYGPAPARAQPASEPILVDDDGKPWSQGVSLETRQAARELFLEGNRRFRIPLFARAAEKYTAALARWKHPAFYFNLALAQLNLGQDVEARESLEHALQYGEEPLGAAQFLEARRQLQELERQLGWIRVTCRTRGAEVTLDGVRLFTGPGSYRGRAKPQDHELAAKHPGYLSATRRVTVAAGRLQEVELKLLTRSEAADASRRWSVWKPWAVVAAGGAIAAAGGVVHAYAARSFEAYDARFQQLPCVTMPDREAPGCTEAQIGPALNARLKLARRQQAIAVGGYIAGGSLLAAGVVLLSLNRPRLGEQGAAGASARRVAIVPAMSGDTLGILVSVSH